MAEERVEFPQGHDEVARAECPHCAGVVELPGEGEGERHYICPHCGEAFTVGDEGAADAEARREVERRREAEREREAELNGARIRQLSTMRRAAYRSRSYCVVGMATCAVLAVQLGIYAWRAGVVWEKGLYAAMGAGLVWLGWVFARWAAGFHREARKSALEEMGDAEPDFSTLGDGSDEVKRLEEM